MQYIKPKKPSLPIYFLLIAFGLSLGVKAQNTFTPRQRAWLYRVTAQTPTLQNNCNGCFKVNTDSFTAPLGNTIKTDYNKIEAWLTASPDSLAIDFDCLAQQSHGIIAELAVKTSIWELARHLKLAIITLPNANDTVFGLLATKIIKKLPKKEQRKPHSKRTIMTLAVVMHPSLPFTAKQEKLNLLKYEPVEQKAMLDEWSRVTATWIANRSQYYFEKLAGIKNFYAIKMMAAGDGSGTAGVLYEYEPHPNDTTRNGYGVGIGLFTYQYATKSEAVVTLPQTVTAIELPPLDTVAIHCSLFGLDSSRKPMIVFTIGDKSYHLFTGMGALTPNPMSEDGISHIDRIRQTIQARINKPLENLDKEGGLNAILEKELKIKEDIESQLRTLEAEIDTLQRSTPINQTAIDAKRRQINTLLTNLTSKERRIADVSRKLSDAYRKIDQSRNIVAEMESVLGPNPQPYTQNGNLYTFADGVVFDFLSQDLLIPKQKQINEVSVRLIPASITMGGASKDEVQMFVNTTKAVKPHKPVLLAQKPMAVDTTFLFFYQPDAYQTAQNNNEISSLVQLSKGFAKVLVVPQIKELGEKPKQRVTYTSPNREKQLPLTPNGQLRQTKVGLKSNGDTLVINIVASTDHVATRLSQLPGNRREDLGIQKAQWEHNQWLAWLRAAWMVQNIAQQLPNKIEIMVDDANRLQWEKVQIADTP